jgi:hypothetical protein
MEKIKIGTIVNYHCTPAEQECKNNNTKICPAIVVQSWGAPGAAQNLRILFDGPETGWKTSVSGKYSEDQKGGFYSMIE